MSITYDKIIKKKSDITCKRREKKNVISQMKLYQIETKKDFFKVKLST